MPVKPVCGKGPMKRRGISSKEVTSFRGKIIKMAASQRKNERDLTIYTEQIYLQKLIFNIHVRREVRSVIDMMEFNWASILR